MSAAEPQTVRVPATYTVVFTVIGLVVGLLAAVVVGPVVGWLLGLIGDAPGPLRLAAELPFAWALPVLGVLGAVGGFLIAANWTEEAGTVEVTDRGVTVRTKDADRFIGADRIDRIVTAEKELVILDGDSREIYRARIEDEMLPGLRDALASAGYPEPLTADPFAGDFTTWTDGDGALGEDAEALLRSRRRALADDKPGAAEEALDALRERGVMVRDRDGRQQFRQVRVN